MARKIEESNMAKIAKKLTDTEIKAPNLPKKRLTFLTAMVCCCESLPGEGREEKLVFQICSACDQKRTKVSLGTYPHLTLAKARALRDEYLSLLTNGIDPKFITTKKPMH
jgi:hypothetical protein